MSLPLINHLPPLPVHFIVFSSGPLTPNQTKNVISVKGGCISGLDWSKAIHIWTNSAMVPIPEGSESHSEESGWADYGQAQETLDQPSVLTGSGGDMPEEGKPIEGACELSG